MDGRFLLDTNIVIALFSEETSIKESLLNSDQVFVPSIVLGELYYGAYKSSRVEENILRIDEFAANNTILVPNTVTALEYGKLYL